MSEPRLATWQAVLAVVTMMIAIVPSIRAYVIDGMLIVAEDVGPKLRAFESGPFH